MTRRRALLFLALAPVLALAACGRRGPLKRVKKAKKKDKKRPEDDANMD